jgi:Holliday junction resolvasome RuvABC DNA-binding subunit
MNGLANLLLGAALVAIGVLAAALADRVRVVSGARDRTRRYVGEASSRHSRNADHEVEVIGALVDAGYRKRVAVAATAGCAPEQRATVEAWTRAALRRCAHGGV